MNAGGGIHQIKVKALCRTTITAKCYSGTTIAYIHKTRHKKNVLKLKVQVREQLHHMKTWVNRWV